MFEQLVQGQRQLSSRLDEQQEFMHSQQEFMHSQLSGLPTQLDSLEQQLKETNLTVQENHATVLSRLQEQQVPPIMQPPSQELLDSQSAEHRLSQPVSPAVHAAAWVERQGLLKSLLAHMVRALNDGNLAYHVKIGRYEPFKGFMLQWIQDETLLSGICDELAAERWFNSDIAKWKRTFVTHDDPSLIQVVARQWSQFKTNLKALVLAWFKDEGLHFS